MCVRGEQYKQNFFSKNKNKMHVTSFVGVSSDCMCTRLHIVFYQNIITYVFVRRIASVERASPFLNQTGLSDSHRITTLDDTGTFSFKSALNPKTQNFYNVYFVSKRVHRAYKLGIFQAIITAPHQRLILYTKIFRKG